MLLPQALAGQKVALLESGWKHSMAVTEGGRFYSWGRNVNGQVWKRWRQGGRGRGGAAAPVCSPGRRGPLPCWPATNRCAGPPPLTPTLLPLPRPSHPPLPPTPPQLGHSSTQDCNTPVEVPALSAGGIDVEALMRAAQPVAMFSVAPSDRYAVVPDSDGGGGGDGLVSASGRDEVPDASRDAKRPKV